MSSKMVHVMVSEQIVALQMELAEHHPDLLKELELTASTFEDCIAILASKFDIVLHGDYSGQDINHIVDLIVRKLRDSRTIIILGSNSGVLH